MHVRTAARMGTFADFEQAYTPGDESAPNEAVTSPIDLIKQFPTRADRVARMEAHRG